MFRQWIAMVGAMMLLPVLASGQTGKPTEQSTPVPFVGCPSDGQVGPVAAPKGADKTIRMDPGAAARLAYYKAEYSPGILAPRGWNCFCMYGSNGSTLLVAPQLLKRDDLFSPKWRGITGSAMQVSVSEGDTSGRFEVARMIARVFPKERAFTQRVISEKIEPASDFPFGPYPKDKIVYKGDRIVEYQTPPNLKGLGTRSRLLPNNLPIGGVVILSDDYALFFLSMRLPSGTTGISHRIIQQFEKETAQEMKR
jgi:hypothetical protein